MGAPTPGRPFVLLTPTQFANKALVEEFKAMGYEPIESKPLPTSEKDQACRYCGAGVNPPERTHPWGRDLETR